MYTVQVKLCPGKVVTICCDERDIEFIADSYNSQQMSFKVFKNGEIVSQESLDLSGYKYWLSKTSDLFN